VRRRERVEDLRREEAPELDRQRADPIDHGPERLARKALHDEDGRLTRKPLKIRNLNNVWMPECGGGARLSFETLHLVGWERALAPEEELDGDRAAEALLGGLVDRAHRALTEERPDPVRPSQQAAFERFGGHDGIMARSST